ncbi:MAG: PAS domain S-box protein [Deltaproteobacteria bacterium]|nr:PAS domain S-box protein [Deltaproteobacteria bacterium]
MTMENIRAQGLASHADDSAVLRALVALEKEPHESFFQTLVGILAGLLGLESVVAVEFPAAVPRSEVGEKAEPAKVLAVSDEGKVGPPFPMSKPSSGESTFSTAITYEKNAGAFLGPKHPLILYFAAESVVAMPLWTQKGKVLGWLAASSRSPRQDLAPRRAVLEIFAHRAVAELEYRRVNQALHVSRGRYRRFFEDSLAGAFVSKPNGEILACNAAFAEMLGHPSQQALLRTNAADLYWEVKDRNAYLDRLRRDGKVRYSDIRLRRCDGSSLYVSGSVRGTFDTDGELIEINGFVIDETERKLAQERVTDQVAMLNRTDDAVLVCTVEGAPIFWNRGAEDLFGIASSDAGTLGLLDLLGDVKDLDLGELWKIVLKSGEWQGDLERPQGESRTQIVKTRWSLLRDDTGQPTSVLMIGADVTENRALESAVLRTQRMESLGTLAGGIAHDLNNVLAPIQLSLQLLKSRLPSKEDQHLLKILASAAKRASEMVRQVLWFARGVEGKRFPVSLVPLVEELHRIFRETMPRSIEVTAEYSRDVPTVLGDATQIYQVLMNLCLNARDAMPSGGHLLIKLDHREVTQLQASSHSHAHAGPHVVLEVTDTGCGIPAESLDLIFDPFFSTKAERSGTGLGLTTAYSIVKSHGGFIDVLSQPDQGTSFRVYLPPVEEMSSQSSEESAPDLTPVSLSKTILLVDDNIVFLKVASKVLREAGHRILVAAGGVEALDLFAEKSSDIDAVLCDQEMAYLDGTSTLRLMRRMKPDIKIALVSGLPDFKSGIDSVVVLRKPCTAEMLLNTLGQLFDASEEVPSLLPEWKS